MFWDKKNKGNLPELPPLDPKLVTPPMFPQVESESVESTETHHLPSFPDSPNEQGMSQSAIKDAIDTPEKMNQFEKLPIKIKELDSDESFPISPPVEEKISPPTRMKTESQSNVFVKIDKFNSARKAISSAQQKISEIDRMLRKIRETRMREEQELTAWEKEVESAKARIEEASKSLFDKLS